MQGANPGPVQFFIRWATNPPTSRIGEEPRRLSSPKVRPDNVDTSSDLAPILSSKQQRLRVADSGLPQRGEVSEQIRGERKGIQP